MVSSPTRVARWRAALVGVALATGAMALGGCVVVPRYARGLVADPAMQPMDGLLTRSIRKLRNSREGAAGGDGFAAGGGCGCGQ